METIKIIETLTIIYGICCISMSFYAGYLFYRVKQKISKAISDKLYAEGFLNITTCLFALTSWLDFYDQLTPSIVVTLRITMFTISAITSIQLLRNIEKR